MNNADKSNNKTMNTEFKGTKGAVLDEGSVFNPTQGYKVVDIKDPDGWPLAQVYAPSFEVLKHNAELVVDSFNTIQSCGLLPSELLKQRDEMRDMLYKILNGKIRPREYESESKLLCDFLESTEVKP